MSRSWKLFLEDRLSPVLTAHSSLSRSPQASRQINILSYPRPGVSLAPHSPPGARETSFPLQSASHSTSGSGDL